MFDSTIACWEEDRPWNGRIPGDSRVLLAGKTVPTAVLAALLAEFCTAVTLTDFDRNTDAMDEPLGCVSPDEIVPESVSRQSGLVAIDTNEYGIRARYDGGDIGYYDVAIVRRGDPPVEVSGPRVVHLGHVDSTPVVNTALALGRVGYIGTLLAPSDEPGERLWEFDCGDW